MINAFVKDGKHYYCKNDQVTKSLWACCDVSGTEVFILVQVPSYRIKRQDVIDAFSKSTQQKN